MRDRTLRGAGCAFALMTLASACGEPPARPIAYRAEYHYDWQGAYLVQTGVDAKICLRDLDMTAAIQPEFAESGGVSDVVVRGLLSPAGSYGIDGECTYELTQAELLGVGDRREREL